MRGRGPRKGICLWHIDVYVVTLVYPLRNDLMMSTADKVSTCETDVWNSGVTKRLYNRNLVLSRIR